MKLFQKLLKKGYGFASRFRIVLDDKHKNVLFHFLSENYYEKVD